MLNETRSLIKTTSDEVVATLRSEIDQLRDTIATVQEDVAELKNSNAARAEKNDLLQKDMSLLESRQQNFVRIAVEEAEERRRRKSNIIISGVPESLSESVEEKRRFDLDASHKIFSALDLFVRCAHS